MTTEQQKIWERKANRVLKKDGLRLAKSDEAGWYFRFLGDGSPGLIRGMGRAAGGDGHERNHR